MSDNQQTQHPTIKKMVEFCPKVMDKPYRGMPNIISYDQTTIDKHEEWQKAAFEIRAPAEGISTYMLAVGRAVKGDEALDGVVLIKQIQIQYYLVPVGTPDFILKCEEIAKTENLTILQ